MGPPAERARCAQLPLEEQRIRSPLTWQQPLPQWPYARLPATAGRSGCSCVRKPPLASGRPWRASQTLSGRSSRNMICRRKRSNGLRRRSVFRNRGEVGSAPAPSVDWQTTSEASRLLSPERVSKREGLGKPERCGHGARDWCPRRWCVESVAHLRHPPWVPSMHAAMRWAQDNASARSRGGRTYN